MTPSPLIPGTTEPTLRLSVPDDGIRDGDLLLRLPRETDIDVLLPVFADPELREAGNLPDMSRDEALSTLPLLPALAESGRLAPVVATDAESGALLGGATLHHLDAERAIVEIGYWLLPGVRGRIMP